MAVPDRFTRAHFDLGERTGPDGRYRIARKLASGQCSDVWLAQDTSTRKYVAVKALSAWMTFLHDRGVVWEADAFRLVSGAPHCARLLDEFAVPGDEGRHRCLVMPFYGGDVGMLQRRARRGSPFPLPLAKRICLHLLRAIARLHARGVVHTDLKGDNIYYETTLDDADIDAWLQRDPSRYGGSLPVISEGEAEEATYLLADFGWAQPSKGHPSREISAVALRAPEVYLGAEWDKPADIWSFGCLVYEFIAHDMLFSYQPNVLYGLTATENILYQMIMHTEQSFKPEQLAASPRAAEFFTPDGRLKELPVPDCERWPLEELFPHQGRYLGRGDAVASATFIRRCLRLDPGDRATAAQLLKDKWFADAA